MTAPRRSGAEQANMRGLIVLVATVIIGFGLLAKSNGLVGSASTRSNDSKSTTTSSPSTTTRQSTLIPTETTGGGVPSAAHQPGDVKVLVVNAAGGQVGVAKKNGDLLTAAGFNVVDLKNSKSAPATIVYFKPGFQADAEKVKTAVKVASAQIVAAPATPIVPGAKDADVTVALGQDYKG